MQLKTESLEIKLNTLAKNHSFQMINFENKDDIVQESIKVKPE